MQGSLSLFDHEFAYVLGLALRAYRPENVGQIGKVNVFCGTEIIHIHMDIGQARFADDLGFAGQLGHEVGAFEVDVGCFAAAVVHGHGGARDQVYAGGPLARVGWSGNILCPRGGCGKDDQE